DTREGTLDPTNLSTNGQRIANLERVTDAVILRCRERISLVRNRMREIRTSGSVRGGGGNVPTYSAADQSRLRALGGASPCHPGQVADRPPAGARVQRRPPAARSYGKARRVGRPVSRRAPGGRAEGAPRRNRGTTGAHRAPAGYRDGQVRHRGA